MFWEPSGISFKSFLHSAAWLSLNKMADVEMDEDFEFDAAQD